MSILPAIGVMLLILLGITLLCVAVVWIEKRFPGKSHDERQEQSRGKAFQLSFGVSIFYYGFATVLLMAQQKQGQIIEPYLLVFGGIIIQVMVYHSYCMVTQSFMSLSQQPHHMVMWYLILGVIASAVYRFTEQRDLLKEMGYPASIEWIFLGLAVIMFFLAFCYLCQQMYQRLHGERE